MNIFDILGPVMVGSCPCCHIKALILLVEVPCVKRNVIGAVNAVSSAEIALAGIESRIPPDQVIDAMREVGDKMDISLRETGQGGLAGTPYGRDIEKRLFASS